MVFEWRGCIWDFSWCLMQNILIRANNKNNADWVKPVGVFMVRMLGVIAWPQEQSAWWISHFDSLALSCFSLEVSFILSPFLIYHSQLQNIWPQIAISSTGDTLIYSFLSWFSISQGRNWFIHLGIDVHFWSNWLWLGVGYKEKFWAIQLGKSPVVTKACYTIAWSYRKAIFTSLTKQHHAHRAAASSDLLSDLFWWRKVNL